MKTLNKLMSGMFVFFSFSLVSAQEATEVVSNVPSPENPLPAIPFDFFGAIEYLIRSFQSAWYIGVAIALFIFVNILRGKVKLGAWVIRIPKFSDWLDGTGSKFKFWTIISLTGIGMGFTSLALIEVWEAMVIVKAVVGGVSTGVLLALAAMGVKSGWRANVPAKEGSDPQ